MTQHEPEVDLERGRDRVAEILSEGKPPEQVRVRKPRSDKGVPKPKKAIPEPQPGISRQTAVELLHGFIDAAEYDAAALVLDALRKG